MWKRVVSSLVGVTLILCAFVGVEKIKSGLPSAINFPKPMNALP